MPVTRDTRETPHNHGAGNAADRTHPLVVTSPRLACLRPSLSDWVFCSILIWLFFGSAGAVALLADGDTGWHIRAGEYILHNRALPREDLFSYSMQGSPWFAWEWLADVVFALAHAHAGLAGVVFLAGILIASSVALLLHYMIWRGANILMAVLATLLFASVSTIHWLARPHLFTWLFLLGTVWLLESDRARPGSRLYLLVPLAALWTNIHGGFAGLLVTVGIYAAGGSAEQLWNHLRPAGTAGAGEGWPPWCWVPPAAARYGSVLLLSLPATLLNPYGWKLHSHIANYLKSDFILKNVQEFQAPNFRGESELIFEIALLGGVLIAGRLLARREVTPALMTLAWGHAALMSVRHLPLFMLVAAPIVTRELTQIIESVAQRGNPWLKALRGDRAFHAGNAGLGSPSFGWLSGTGAAVVLLMLCTQTANPRWRAEFSDLRFPARACDALGERLGQRRLLSTDQWGDYLIYRFYPRARVFVDGRSDFYANRVGGDYLVLLNAAWSWEQVFDKYEFDAALLPASWALASALKLHPEWSLRYDDGFAVYFEKSERESGAAEPLKGGSPAPLPRCCLVSKQNPPLADLNYWRATRSAPETRVTSDLE